MPNRMLLAIGGPRNFEWLPDLDGPSLVVPVMKSAKWLPPYETATYRKQRFTDGHRQIKTVYVSDQFRGNVTEALKEYLLEQFMLMEDPIDGD